jgi:hypothetical protein
LSIEPPTESRPTVLLTAAADGLRCVVELTLPAAGNLAASLRTVTVVATAAADLTTEEDQS